MRLSIFKTVLLCAVAFVCASPAAQSQDTGEKGRKKERLEKEIALIDRQLQDNKSKSKDALSELTLIQKKISNRNKLIKESDERISEISDSIALKQAEVSALQNRLDTLSTYYSLLVKNAYKNRDSKVWYMYILSSENLSQAFRRIGYLKGLSSQMNIQAKKIEQTKAVLEDETEALQKMRMEAQVLKNQRVSEVSALQKEEGQSQEMVKKLGRERTKYQKQLNEKRRQVEQLDREIAAMIRKSTGKGSTASKTQIDTKLDGEFAKNKGKLPWPADGPVVESFGQHYHPVFKNVKLPFNNGISIALSPDTPVHVVFDGVVKQIVVIPGYSKCVLVQHGNYFSLYGKMGNVAVKSGDKVKTGQAIGTVGTIDGATQLYLQIWKGTSPQDPEDWLKP